MPSGSMSQKIMVISIQNMKHKRREMIRKCDACGSSWEDDNLPASDLCPNFCNSMHPVRLAIIKIRIETNAFRKSLGRFEKTCKEESSIGNNLRRAIDLLKNISKDFTDDLADIKDYSSEVVDIYTEIPDYDVLEKE